MTQDWLFDFGNTRLKCAPLGADGGVGDVRAFAPSEIDSLPSGGVAYLASVAGEDARVRLLDALTGRFRRIAIARTTATFDGLRIAYANPRKLGVDRFLAMIGARDAWPALVVGVGTGLTIDLVDAGGLHRGGRIAPSPTLMREMLHARATQLAPIGGTYAEFANDTEDALVSGCDGAAVALIERSATEATRLLGSAPTLLLHGGGADALHAHLPDARVRSTLVLEGLARWAHMEAAA
ncbi:Pantothenate kinase type III [Lysobacter dokdonensis DS-58]|uniref:Type III pantothenate kinase n=1 Tax=Lysobacter dokdonensis DS-58 TaxID=1300345 RepID=A0A0A2WXV7_9GAMM|nr:type III pantothenate kinase [Lysobacter dokdonensis]KGQ17859.1 Pantothenate kinase type III [Lysobacter dokdonensis DS-58]